MIPLYDLNWFVSLYQDFDLLVTEIINVINMLVIERFIMVHSYVC